ncbi:MAG: CPBP family intramembrane metalloprotease [Defluviimonas sp.]|uniref:CPBP family intramembrane glutamic endopeptidase n=1 Tax=Albidovulum sp. TaxID=1872424 RepID=UPI001D465776|nr:CPBP family intramembrane metalloprotease [Paracoccaceae bacterium]MCC0063251.1 CPBP family intramembrane metalloprotease [Defluviimonas sp.]
MPALPRPYLPHEAFVAAARTDWAWWRLVLCAITIVVVYVGALMLFSAYLTARYGGWIAAAIARQMAEGNTPGMALLLFYSFLALAIGALFAVRAIHRRSAAMLFGPRPREGLREFWQVSLPVIGLSVVLLPLGTASEEVTRGLETGDFLFYLPFALVGLLVQTTAEELVFRGYLQQQIAARFPARVLWMGIPSALFGLAHYAPAEFGESSLVVVLWAFLFGLCAADLTARTGRLGAAIGLHFANNVSAVLLVCLAGNLDGLALWRIAPGVAGGSLAPYIATDFVALFASWLLARLALRV